MMSGPKKKRPLIRKLGTLACDTVETTPVVFRGRLYRFEYVRDRSLPPGRADVSHFHFVDVQTGQSSPPFAHRYHLGSAYIHQDVAYAFGVEKWGAASVRVFSSHDLSAWSHTDGLVLPGWQILNTSVCDDSKGFVMAFEIDAPPEETGVPYTVRFARSKDLLSWTLTPASCVFSKDRYTACPAIRFFEGWYYMVYLEALPGPRYESFIVRSRDLENWNLSPLNPFLSATDEDRLIANPRLTEQEREDIRNAVDRNNSDVDFCDYEGKTVMYYSWGNQKGVEHLAEAECDGSLRDLLQGFFPTV